MCRYLQQKDVKYTAILPSTGLIGDRLSEAVLALSALAEGTGSIIKGERERHRKEGKGENI